MKNTKVKFNNERMQALFEALSPGSYDRSDVRGTYQIDPYADFSSEMQNKLEEAGIKDTYEFVCTGVEESESETYDTPSYSTVENKELESDGGLLNDINSIGDESLKSELLDQYEIWKEEALENCEFESIGNYADNFDSNWER